MSEEELIETLKEFEKKRVEQLPESARNLFYAIMKIADERDKIKESVKECLRYVDRTEMPIGYKQEIKNILGSDKE